MPWQDESLQSTVLKANEVIFQFIGKRPNCPVLICTKKELVREISIELQLDGISKEKIEMNQIFVFPKVIGKFFHRKNEIWILDKEKGNFELFVHEILHSIQKCNPNREGITDYLTYLITKNTSIIDPNAKEEWDHLTRTMKKKKLIERYLSDGDCEDF